MRNVLLIFFIAFCSCDLREQKICVENCPSDLLDAAMVDATIDDATPLNDGVLPDACVPNGAEICDGIDNNCDGQIDELPIAGLGVDCSNDLGICQTGITACQNGAVVCDGGTLPAAEQCDNLDNDCDGNTDENNPSGAQICGSNIGECQTGVTQCQAGGNLVCVGQVTAAAEQCDGLDNDCDGNFDEGLASGGSCGLTNTGECSLGTLQCVGGANQCVGSVNPTTELCDGLDHDCDGNALNGFSLTTDARNCGSCGNVCSAPNATMSCNGGSCAIAVCDPGYWNTDNSLATGCNYGPCQFQSTQEACNQIDDDCDGQIDENLTPPNICDSDGACSGAVPTCTANGWRCNYSANVETDGNGNLVEETRCDGIDNDCDGATDEGDPLLFMPCVDTGIGICQGSGTYTCAANSSDPVVCNVTSPGQSPTAETCNYQDDDCNGVIDDNPGALQQWVSFGGFQVQKYEASKPDATSSSSGAITSHVCSEANRLPWTSINAINAEAACQSIGANLCTESEWQQVCEAGSSCRWSQGSSCTTYNPNTCNGNDYDFDSQTAGDQDGLLPTGSRPQCFANTSGGSVYDLSGNVKEWTAPRSAGVNPQRGGAYSTPAGGMECSYDFAVADDNFLFPTVGFRCCK